MAGYHGWEESADCPRCGGPSVCQRWSDHPEWPRHPQHCPPCQVSIEEYRTEFRSLFKLYCPGLSTRLMCVLRRHYAQEVGGFDALLRADDDEMLAVRNLGPKMLAEFRSAWPASMVIVPIADAWAEHAAMVTLTGGA